MSVLRDSAAQRLGVQTAASLPGSQFASLLKCCVLCNLSSLPCPHLENGHDADCKHIMGLIWKLKE